MLVDGFASEQMRESLDILSSVSKYHYLHFLQNPMPNLTNRDHNNKISALEAMYHSTHATYTSFHDPILLLLSNYLTAGLTHTLR